MVRESQFVSDRFYLSIALVTDPVTARSGMTQSSLPFSNRFALSAVRDDVEFRSLSDEL